MPRSLTNYPIKLLAAILMLIDHVGVVFFPDIYALRALGRFSFPLFAWLLVEGEAHTRHVQRYGFRLLLFGLISQPLYQWVFDASDLNILFLLLIGLICLRGARRFPKLELFFWIGGAILAELLRADYEAYGIAMIALIRHFQPSPSSLWWACWLSLHLLLISIDPGFGAFQFPAVLAPLIFYLTNHQLGAKARWFYWFYPGHLLVLLAIAWWTGEVKL